MFVTAIALLFAGSAHVDVAAPAAFHRTIGEWTIAGDPKADGCVARRPEMGGTQLMIALLASQETVRFTLSNDAWSQLPDGPIEVTGIFLSPTDDVTDYWSLSSIGISQSNGGPAIYFDIWRAKNDGASFIDQFKRASTVVFSKGTVPIGKFDLSGSGAAMSALIDCRDFIRSDPNFDPFAH